MMTKKRLNISSLVYIIARYARLCPCCSGFERDKQIVGTSLCAWSCHPPKCAIFPPRKRICLYINSNFSCTNWQLRLHPSTQFFVRCCSALHRPSPRFSSRRSICEQQIRCRFLRSVLACLCGQFYCCVYGCSRQANWKDSVLPREQAPETIDTQCDWAH